MYLLLSKCVCKEIAYLKCIGGEYSILSYHSGFNYYYSKNKHLFTYSRTSLEVIILSSKLPQNMVFTEKYERIKMMLIDY